MSNVTTLYLEKNGEQVSHIPMNERLKMLRLEKGYTMQQLADYLGIKRSTYAGYEANRDAVNHRYPKMELLIKIATLLETSTDFLLCLTDDKRPRELSRDVDKILDSDNLEWNGVVIDKETRDFVRLVLSRTVARAN